MVPFPPRRRTPRTAAGRGAPEIVEEKGDWHLFRGDAQDPTEFPGNLHSRGGAGIFTGGKGGTLAFWIGPDGALVIDAQFPDSAKTCLTALRTKTKRKLDAVLITHHHADHTAGIPSFRTDAAKVVAHRNVPGLQKAAGKSVEDLAKVDRIPGFPDHAPGWDGAIQANLETAWAEIEG